MKKRAKEGLNKKFVASTKVLETEESEEVKQTSSALGLMAVTPVG